MILGGADGRRKYIHTRKEVYIYVCMCACVCACVHVLVVLLHSVGWMEAAGVRSALGGGRDGSGLGRLWKSGGDPEAMCILDATTPTTPTTPLPPPAAALG
eukprot:GHVU01232451.1.p5 GENE.GHVU01232451.1~~GHVU01232451.1.p5  ORF type:complete len:101 (-),score=14.89 GHVU01232451.1:35-337(-)